MAQSDSSSAQLPVGLAELLQGLPESTQELLDLAWRAASAAGSFLLRGRHGELMVETKSTATDVVTQMDTAAEALILSTVTAARPDDAVLGEETGRRVGGSGVRWVIDPLDGTVNYLYGHPTWAVSIGVEVGGVAEVGVVAVPGLGETFAAVRGHGSYLVDSRGVHRLRVSTPDGLGQALVATGFGYARDRRAAQAATLTAVLPEVRDIRRVGAAAVDLCWLAAARVDAYYERGLNPWDFAAGALVAAEAGAVVGGGPDGPSPDLVWGTCPQLASQFRDLLLGAGADRDGG